MRIKIMKTPVSCAICKKAPELIKFSDPISFQVYYSMKCSCKQTPWLRNEDHVIEQWESLYFKGTPKSVSLANKHLSNSDLLPSMKLIAESSSPEKN